MDYYNIVNCNNGDILLEKKFIDTANYDITYESNGNILLKKKIEKNIIISNLKDLKKINFTKSVITECIINDIKFNSLKFKPILEKIYDTINDGAIIIKKTNLNIKTTKKTNDGFYFLKNIGISVQSVSSNIAIYEIVNQSIENKIKIFLKIKLNKFINSFSNVIIDIK